MSTATPGLAGVTVADTAIGDVRGDEGFFHYRGYSAIELADRLDFEHVWALLLDGELPDRAALERFRAEVRPLRAVAAELIELLPLAGKDRDPLTGLRTAVSALAQHAGMRPTLDLSAEAVRRDALLVSAAVPTLVAALWRRGNGAPVIGADPDLDPATDYLRMLTGQVPSPESVRAINRYLIATADHGFNASTFTARVITSTGADVGAAVTGAIGALSGPLHGTAPGRVLDMLDEFGGPSEAEAYVRERVARGERIMGFGHRVYRTEDPRAAMLRATASSLGGPRIADARDIEQVILATLAELKPGKELHVNVEFWAGIVMEAAGIPRALCTATFAVSRVVGWTAHVREQAATGRLIRPSARYVGTPPPRLVSSPE